MLKLNVEVFASDVWTWSNRALLCGMSNRAYWSLTGSDGPKPQAETGGNDEEDPSVPLPPPPAYLTRAGVSWGWSGEGVGGGG